MHLADLRNWLRGTTQHTLTTIQDNQDAVREKRLELEKAVADLTKARSRGKGRDD